tara:strand:- start:10401 stop:10577 length:177 start_codon:yes stop_codon:yes gene_type:complete
MANIKTITQEITSGSLSNISNFLNDTETRENNGDHHLVYLLKEKIEELIVEINILKNQ